MGFEVLDSRGEGASSPDDQTSAAVDVVQLDDPPNPTITRPPRNRRAAARGATLAVVSLIAGAVVGGYVVGRHEEGQQRQARRASFAATAIISDFSPSAGSGRTVVNLTARVTNQGPLPITVVTTPTGESSGTRVSVVGSSPAIAPGASTLVTVHLHVACDKPGSQLAADLSVRTADGREHRLTLGPSAGASSLLDACSANNADVVRATVVGPFTRPTLLLTNGSDKDLRFTLGNGIGPVEFNGPIIIVKTKPAMPVRVGAGTSIEVQLIVTARRCLGDLSLMSGNNYLNVDVTGTSSSASSTGVDIGALVGAAVARACAKR